MLADNIASVTAEDILRLIADEIPESKTIDFKERLLLSKDGVRSLCEHVSSFANADGGWLIYGLHEARDADGRRLGTADQLVGIANSESDDELLRAVDDAVRNGVEPRVRVYSRVIRGFADPLRVLVLHVPRSFRAPHMVKSGAAKFYSRSNAGKEALDVEQLRSSFTSGEAMAEKIREFRAERVGRVAAGETPIALLSKGGRVVLHVVPVDAFLVAADDSAAVHRAHDWNRSLLLCSHRSSYGYGFFNLDGYCSYEGREDAAFGYALVFRRGMIELVDSMLLDATHGSATGKLMANVIERELVGAVERAVGFLRDGLALAGSCVLMVSLLDVRGFKLDVEEHRLPHHRSVDRAHLLLPDVVLVDLETPDLPGALRPVFDAMWQAGGVRGSPNFGPAGTWTRPK